MFDCVFSNKPALINNLGPRKKIKKGGKRKFKKILVGSSLVVQ